MDGVSTLLEILARWYTMMLTRKRDEYGFQPFLRFNRRRVCVRRVGRKKAILACFNPS